MRTLKHLCLLSTLILLCLFFTSFHVKIYSSFFSIEHAILKNIVQCHIQSKGGHKGNCIDMSLINQTNETITVKVESGRNLLSLDTNKQDILIVKEEIFVLAPNQQQTKGVFGFCSQSHKSSPSSGEEYTVGEMKDKSTIQLTEYLAKNEYPLSAMQSAIWVMTNNRRVEGIFHQNRDSIQDLMDYVSGLTKQFTPWYSIDYQLNETDLVSDVAKSIYGNFEGELQKNTKVQMVVYDKFNIPQLRKTIIIPDDSYTHPISLDVSQLPKGRYQLCFFTLGGRVDEKVFTI
ncbi:MAG: DUF2572 family protein [Flavobacteriales bacterium]|nr:DUF2572 family protein [Flavobacteriales bacterium]